MIGPVGLVITVDEVIVDVDVNSLVLSDVTIDVVD